MWEMSVETEVVRFERGKIYKIRNFPGSPVVRTLASTAGGTGSISGGRSKIPHVAQHGPKKKARLDDREDMQNEVIKNNSFLTHISRWMVVLFFKLGNKDQRLVCRKFEFSLGHAEFKLLQVEISSVTEHTGLESEWEWDVWWGVSDVQMTVEVKDKGVCLGKEEKVRGDLCAWISLEEHQLKMLR